MMNYIYCKWSILSLLTVFKNVEGYRRCYTYHSRSGPQEYCYYYYDPYTPAFGATYGSLIVIGIVVSLIVWWCCTKKKIQQGSIRIPVTYQSGNLQNQSGNQQSRYIAMASVHGTQSPYIMMTPTQYENPQRQTYTPGELPCASCHASEN